MSRPNPAHGRLLSDPAYEKFWSACERSSIGVVLHEGTHARLRSAGAGRFTTRFAMHACSQVMEPMMAFLALLAGGVLERHPKRGFALLRSACGWIPNWLWRLDDLEFKHVDREVEADVKQLPSAYFRHHCIAASEPGDALPAPVIEHLGDDRLVFATDFPHLDHDEEIVSIVVQLADRVPQARLRRLSWVNAARFFACGDRTLD